MPVEHKAAIPHLTVSVFQLKNIHLQTQFQQENLTSFVSNSVWLKECDFGTKMTS